MDIWMAALSCNGITRILDWPECPRHRCFREGPLREYAYFVMHTETQPSPHENRMNRKKFMVLSGLGLAALSLPVACQFSRKHEQLAVLARPVELSQVCDTATLLSVGAQYRKRRAEENNEDLLFELLLSESAGPPDSLAQMLLDRVRADYENNDTLILDGWVLSRTEARQCALLSFIQPD